MLPILMLPRFDLLVALALIFGVFFGIYLAVDWALVADVLPDPEGYATDMGLWQTSIVLPQVIAGSFGGLIDRANQASAGSGYTLVFLLAAGFFCWERFWCGRFAVPVNPLGHPVALTRTIPSYTMVGSV